MKVTGNYLYLFCCLCLLASRNLAQGYKKFDTYKAAKDHFAKKGILKGPYPFAHEKSSKHYDKDGAVNKDVVHDVMAMLYLCQFIYGLGDLRRETKELSLTEEEIKANICKGSAFSKTGTDAMFELLIGNMVHNPVNAKISMEQIETILQYGGYTAANKRFGTEMMCAAVHSFSKANVFLYHFDAKYNDKNLVYAIAGRERPATHSGAAVPKKEIDLVLTFRGSQTARDWMQNVQTPLKTIALRQDPVDKKCYMIEPLSYQRIEIEADLYKEFLAIEEKSGPIQIHEGFLYYIFADRGEDGLVTPMGPDESMFDHIQENLLGLLNTKSMTTNNLYVTGHSLGGSLATVAAFFLGSSKEFNNRGEDWNGVKCITFAAPSSGNISYQRAFEVLMRRNSHQSSESKEGKSIFSNIRITNNRDLVPMLIPWSRYRHSPGVIAHLGRPSWPLRLMRLVYMGWLADRIQSPKIRRYKAHWKREWDWRYPWMVFNPQGFLAGLFGSWGKFLCFVFATIPLLFVVLQLALRPIYLLLPSILPITGQRILDSDNVRSALTGELKNLVDEVQLLQKYNRWLPITSVFSPIGTFFAWILSFIPDVVKNPIFYPWGLSLLYTSGMLWIMDMNLPFLLRFPAFFLGIPSFVGFFLRVFGSGQAYFWMADYGGSAFIAAMVVWQIIVAFGRAPWDVLPSMKVHDLNSYYEHMLRYHTKLSSSEVLIDKYLKNVK